MRYWPWALLLAVACSGCDDMSRQDKVQAQRPAALFESGISTRRAPEGTVARGQLAREATARQRPPLTEALLARGQTQFQVFCTPCHGLSGHGDGLVVGRGFPAPPALTEARLLDAPDAHLMHVIADGKGLMAGYQSRIAPSDRWAIVAYMRLLQLSQHASLDSLPSELQQAFEERR